MNNEETLIALGFIHYPEWDFKEIGTKHYRLERDSLVFRAYVQHNNPPVYVVIGRVINNKGIVERWKDCVTNGAVQRFINPNHYLINSLCQTT